MIGYIWARESNKYDKTAYSLKSQVAACIAAAEADGLTIPPANIYQERFSGRDLWKMPRLAELRRQLEALRDEPKRIYCYAQDRLVRGEDAFDIFYLLVEFRRYNTEVKFLLKPIDTKDIASQIQILIAGHEASGEISKIRDRTMRGKVERMKEGKVYLSGPEKYGYQRDRLTDNVSIVEREALIIRRIFSWVIGHQGSIGALVRQLNREGVPSPQKRARGNSVTWGYSTIRRILSDPAYKGEGFGHRYKKNGSVMQLRPRNEWIALPGIFPAIVTGDIWQAAQSVIGQNAGNYTRNEKHFLLLRGLVYCSVCDQKMYFQQFIRQRKRKGRRVYRYYRCATHTRIQEGRTGRCKARQIDADKLDADVWARVVALLNNDAVCRQLIADAQPQDTTAILLDDARIIKEAVRQKSAEQKTIAQRLRTAPDAIAYLLQNQLEEIERERLGLLSQLGALQANIDRAMERSAQAEGLMDFIGNVRAKLHRLNPAMKRAILEALHLSVRGEGDCWRVSIFGMQL